MANLAFDTHKYVKRLTAVGMPEKQAEVIAYEQRSLIEDQLATKHDIAEVKRDIEELRAEVKHDIEELRAEVKRDIEELRAATKRDLKELEQRLIIRLGGMMIAGFGVMIAGFGVIAALIKFLPTSAL